MQTRLDDVKKAAHAAVFDARFTRFCRRGRSIYVEKLNVYHYLGLAEPELIGYIKNLGYDITVWKV